MRRSPPPVDREQREPGRIIDVNLGGAVNALEVARALPGLRRFVYVSSGAVWGSVPGATVLDEESPANATPLYGVTKLAGERISLRYGELFGLDVVAVRSSNVCGPMERVTPGYEGATEPQEMLRLRFGGEPILINSLEGPYRDWTYVEDMAEGIERAWEADELPQRVYCLSGGVLSSVGAMLAAFERYLPGLRYRQVAADAANYLVSGDPPGPVPSSARARHDLGWEARTSFDEGMEQYLAWISEHGPR